MEINKTQDGDRVILSLIGRLDTITSSKLQTALSEDFSGATALELDFSDIEYVSSAGLRVLLLGEKRMKADGKTMTLTHVSDDVMEVFEITGFSAILTIA